MQPLIQCKNIFFRYDATDVLRDISFDVFPGEYIGIIGGNGSGKTTLLKIILGLLHPTKGDILFFDQPFADFHDWHKVGYVPQHVFRNDVNFPATVWEIVESGHLDARFGEWLVPGKKKCSVVERSLKQAGIEHLASKRIGELSGGERQRVFIARALVSRPELLVLDEPTTGIDAATEEQFYAFLRTLNNVGMTIILVSHDLEAVEREVKRVLYLNHCVIDRVSKKNEREVVLNEKKVSNI
ncbi:MAG: metal ABC transporter ATP-binding protein [Candidatus Moranbacteria bacterium]|nr:metal ABC transporter ATP-binding protein [Candidatus Moranbacteria bacterium]